MIAPPATVEGACRCVRAAIDGETAIAIRFDDVRRWMFERALPFWSTTGLDRPGFGFVEHLDLDGRPADVQFKRLRLQARQVYVYSHAAILGWDGPALEAARGGVDFMLAHGWLPDGGWARLLGRDGGVLDPTIDLYDQAFAAFGLAWHHRASGEARSREAAERTFTFIDASMRHAQGEGYAHWLPPEGWRLQNPHMHLLEACLAMHAATGDDAHLKRAREIANLFRARLFDPASRTLAEYFTDDWRRAEGADGRIVEPGHQFEWCWLLHEYARVSGDDFSAEAAALFAFAEEYGVNAETGLTYDQIRDDGAVLDDSSRSWPQTEALKAHLAMFEHGGAPLDGPRIAQITDNLLDRYLAYEPAGAWDDHLRRDGSSRSDKIPASTFYHVLLAFSELLRLEHAIRGSLAGLAAGAEAGA